jgi:RNA polymerase sigma-70 factor (ECF subfamily)
MVAAQHGDASSYRRLLNLLRPWFECYYRARLPMAMVEEAVQDALIVVHDKRHTYDAARPFEPWLAAIADYKLIDRLQAMKRVRPVSAEKTAVRKTRFGETPITGLGASSLSAEAIGLPFAGASMMLLRLIGLMVRRRPVSTR